MYSRNSNGTRTLPCGTPDLTLPDDPSMGTCWLRPSQICLGCSVSIVTDLRKYSLVRYLIEGLGKAQKLAIGLARYIDGTG